MNAKQIKAAKKLVYESVKHLRKTGKPSITLGDDGMLDTCNYSGSGCAFAPAFKRKEFRKQADGRGLASHLIEFEKDWIKVWARDLDQEFADEMQAAHDVNWDSGSTFLTDFENSVKKICKICGLNFNEITKDIPVWEKK